VSSTEWPSVEEQLTAHGVRPGSALERLIRAHQDFGVLRPDEAADRLGIPPWLRVYWRRQHPESRYAASDPTGGYPMLIKKYLAMMLANQDRPEWSEAAKATAQKPSSAVTPKRRRRSGR
jgi:hypothetical protein